MITIDEEENTEKKEKPNNKETNSVNEDIVKNASQIETHKSPNHKENSIETKQNTSSKCTHLLSETCTSSCTNDLETLHESQPGTSKSNSEAFDLGPPRADIFNKLFFQSPKKKPDITTVISPTKKVVIPRLKQKTYGEVLTTEDVLKRLREAEEKKCQKKTGKTTQESTKRKLSSKKKQTIKNKKKKPDINDETTDEESVQSLNLSDGSSSIDLSVNDDSISVTKTPISELRNGSFVLVQFMGGKRNTTVFRYVCSVENVLDTDVDVVGLRSIDITMQNFAVHSSDTCFVTEEQILGVLPFPTIKNKGERIYYQFDKKVDVLEG